MNNDKYTYTLNKNKDKIEHNYYTYDELILMTTYKLKEICYKEKIINGILSPLDKDELIKQIMRFRGKKDKFFITEKSETGVEILEDTINKASISYENKNINGIATIILYEGLSTGYFDKIRIQYDKQYIDTNAILVSGNKICTIFNIRDFDNDGENLYLTKSRETICIETNVKNYILYIMDKVQSDIFYKIYNNEINILPKHIKVCKVPVMNFEIRKVEEASMPLAIDFGSSNTTAGIYLTASYFENLKNDHIAENMERDSVNYVKFLDDENKQVPMLPTSVCIISVDKENVKYEFGYNADKIFKDSYIDDGFCIFYDLKRWICDCEKLEEVVDINKNRSYIKRKEIIKAYFENIIDCAMQRFKCKFTKIHISSPVKQKKMFLDIFLDILKDYEIETTNMLDEGVCVLYNSISDIINSKKYIENEEYKALIIDCGGGTTDLSSCSFRIEDKGVSYKINIETSYENGDTDFGGNNLTFRIMQMLKIYLAYNMGYNSDINIKNIEFFDDIFREIEENGIKYVYQGLDNEYNKAENIIPTRFKNYENKSSFEYYSIKNNFYFLFEIAEKIKKEFYSNNDILRIKIESVFNEEIATKSILVDRWKMYIKGKNGLQIVKDIEPIYFSLTMLNKLLKADIYNIIKRFIEPIYKTGEINEFSIIRLTGQSCKIEIFREALKEFIAGKLIKTTKKQQNSLTEHNLKLICLDGAIKYLRDINFGYADVNIEEKKSALPYIITAITHTGDEKVLIHSLDRNKDSGYISRNMADLSLELQLKSVEEKELYKYNCTFLFKQFWDTTAEKIVQMYENKIPQDDIDSIINKEIRFFILANDKDWGFFVIPVLRNDGQIMIAEHKFFMFEIDAWVSNFFDGTR